MKNIYDRTREIAFRNKVYYGEFVTSFDECKKSALEGATEQKAIDIEKACQFVDRKGFNSYWLRKYLEGKIPIDYDGINPCDTCSNNEEYLNGGECYCSKLEE